MIWRRSLVTALGLVIVGFTGPTLVRAADPCPTELGEAKAALAGARASLKKSTQVAKGGQEVQAPRAQAGAKSSQDLQAPRGQDVQAPRGQDVQAPRGQDVQAPRGQDVQAPRGQDVQAPRGQDVQAPRGQDVQAPRGQDVQAPRAPAGAKAQTPQAGVNKAAELVKQSEAACKKGDMAASRQKATEALTILKKPA